MEIFFGLIIILLGVAIVVMSPVGFFIALSHGRRLSDLEKRLKTALSQIEDLKASPRAARLETAPETAPPPVERAAAMEAASGPPPIVTRPIAAPPPIVAEPEPPVVADVEPPVVAEPAPPPPPPTLGDAAISEPNAPPAPPPIAAPARKPSLEESLGARWTVWVGGVAIALGALLLVRYSIEAGFFGPAARVALGLILAAALVGAGEWLRQREAAPGSLAGVPGAYIPGVLTGAGIIAAFGAIYAAHALYGFIGPGVAFVALGATGILAMLAAILHGPGLAGLGLVGSLAAPLLVESQDPKPWPVVVYVAIIVATSYALASARGWLWLALCGVAGGGLWSLLLYASGHSADGYHAALISLAIQTALAAYALAIRPHRAARDEDPGLDLYSSAALGGLTLAALFILHVHGGERVADAWWIVSVLATVGALTVAGVLAIPSAAAAALAGLLALAAAAYWPAADSLRSLDDAALLAHWAWPAPMQPSLFVALCLVIGLVPAAAFGKRLFDGAQLTEWPAYIFAGAATLTPLGMLAIIDLRLGEGHPSWPIAAGAAFLAAWFTGGARVFQSRLSLSETPATRLGLGVTSAAAIAALTSGLVYALDGAALTVALAAGALGTAFTATRVGVPALRWCVAAIGVAVAGRLAWEPRIVGAALSTTPIFNWLLFGYGAPALCFGFAGFWLRREREDTPSRVADALAVLFSALLFFFEIRHFTNHGDPFARGSGLVEQALLATTSFSFAIVLTRLDAARANIVFRWASLGAGAIGVGLAAVGLLLVENPLIDGSALEGGLFINPLLLGYLLPALLAGALGYFARSVRPGWYWGGALAMSALLALAYAVLEIRVLLHGQTIGYEEGFTLSELGLDVSLGVGLGMIANMAGAGNPKFERAATLILAIAAAVAIVGLGVLVNPGFTDDAIAGGPFFNGLLIGYALPCALTLALSRHLRSSGENSLGAITGVAAILLLFVYVTLQTRRVFQGEHIGFTHDFTANEWYAYSAVWLALGLALLAYGVARHVKEARFASAFFIVATTLKVFLFDLSGLEGVQRAMSFLGLGAALIGIGLVYQKWVFAKPKETKETE